MAVWEFTETGARQLLTLGSAETLLEYHRSTNTVSATARPAVTVPLGAVRDSLEERRRFRDMLTYKFQPVYDKLVIFGGYEIIRKGSEVELHLSYDATNTLASTLSYEGSGVIKISARPAVDLPWGLFTWLSDTQLEFIRNL